MARHAPYMHDGSMATLREVVEYYNRGGNANPYMDPKMPAHPLQLTPTDVDDLVAMLESLSGTWPRKQRYKSRISEVRLKALSP